MTNLGRRLRKLEAQSPTGEDIVTQIEYVNEPPKSFHGRVPKSDRGPLVTGLV
jgi:hypothetical protein